MSRNEFLKNLLENFATSETLSQERNRLSETYEQVGKILAATLKRLESLEQNHEKLFNLLLIMMELSPDEVEHFLKIENERSVVNGGS